MPLRLGLLLPVWPPSSKFIAMSPWQMSETPSKTKKAVERI